MDDSSRKDVITPVIGYFNAVSTRDAEALRAVFADDAELQDPKGLRIGPDDIVRGFEERFFNSEDLLPEAGPLIVDGNRVAVEIRLQMKGEVHRLSDFFTIEDGKVKRLDIYWG